MNRIPGWRRLRGWKPSLLTSFSLLGGFITVVIAVIFAFGLQYQLEQNALGQEAASAADQVTLILSPNLTQADLSAPVAPARYAEIDALIHRDVLHAHIVRVKIWSKGGLLLYSDDKILVGQYFPATDELKKALAGAIATDVSTLNQVENVGERGLYTRLLEVYIPIRLGGSDQVAGVYEIYHDLAVLDPSIAATRRFVWVGVGSGFLILYGSLFVLVRNASRALVHRNEENKRLYEQEQTRRAELGALYDLSRALADAHDFDTTLALVTRHAVETVHVTFSRVALLEGDEFVIRAAYPVRSLDHNLKVGERDTLGSNQVCQRVLEQNLPAVISADGPGLSQAEREMLFIGMAETVCLIPLRAGERALGLLMFGEARSDEREPFTADKMRLARSIGEQAASALYRVELFAQLEESYLHTVLALANAVDAKDNYTSGHAQRLAGLALGLGREMGMTEHELEGLRYGAILHDIGKIGVPDAVLQKPAALNPAEWALMRQHPTIGARILAPVPHLANAAQIVRHHHERYDGKGYPAGLAGEAIPLGARILTVVDSYSAIRDRRVYKEARSHAEAVAELRKHTGTQFDPRVVELFLATHTALDNTESIAEPPAREAHS
jgi:HD-GYP domain-containing protein (c-di-GMP phosphodiesterase class II)